MNVSLSPDNAICGWQSSGWTACGKISENLLPFDASLLPVSDAPRFPHQLRLHQPNPEGCRYVASPQAKFTDYTYTKERRGYPSVRQKWRDKMLCCTPIVDQRRDL